MAGHAGGDGCDCDYKGAVESEFIDRTHAHQTLAAFRRLLRSTSNGGLYGATRGLSPDRFARSVLKLSTGADPPRMSAFDPKRTLGWRMRDVALSAPKRSISLRLDDARASDCRFPGVPLQAAT
jgi:hypothetical protein